jgi:flagellar transcriptional activator FlhD
MQQTPGEIPGPASRPDQPINGKQIMNQTQLLTEIREINLSYLMLAQNLIRQDRAEALFRLGLTEESADLIAALSSAQLLKIASSNMLLCRMRIDDSTIWELLSNHGTGRGGNDTTARLHASILMAGKFKEAM